MTPEDRMNLENAVQEKTDDGGNRWHKVYSGGGSHFRNWLDQIKEIYGEENVEIEEVNSNGLRCYTESGEKMYRIWAKQKK